MKRINQDDRGAALVEFAVSAILLFTLLFGIIEAGWAFFNLLDVRHSANEGARLAAVNIDPLADICDSLDPNFSAVPIVKISFEDDDGDTVPELGERVIVQVEAAHKGLSGFIAAFDSFTFSESETYRIEQDITTFSPAVDPGTFDRPCP